MLIDASKLGSKIKDGNNQKTILSDDDIMLIENTFIKQDIVDDFSVKVTYDDIIKKNYSLSAGQYFDVKIEYVEITQEQFKQKIAEYTTNLNRLFAEGKALEDEIKQKLGKLKYEDD